MIVSVAGAGGFVGGELLRLIEGHPELKLGRATSDRFHRRRLDTVHPALRGRTDERFSAHDDLDGGDVLFVSAPAGVGMRNIGAWRERFPLVIDLGPDLRLRDPEVYRRYYGEEHSAPELLAQRVLGIPELFRDELSGASLVSVPGCMASAAILALHPLAGAGLLDGAVTVCGLTGSSGSGRRGGRDAEHAARSGVMRVYKPVDHRHEAEIEQVCGVEARMTAVAVEAVRGVQVVCSVATTRPLEKRDVWRAYLSAYADEPFVRLDRSPEPKLLSGTNYCDIGFAVAANGRHLTSMAAADNLVKGAAGAAVQCLNAVQGWDERRSLEFEGLYPA